MITIRKTSVRNMNNRQDMQNKDKEATVYLYGDVGGWFGIDHEEFVKNLNSINADVIHLRVASDGGDIFAARAIKTAIVQHKSKIIGHIDGIAASAASFLIMGCDEIEIIDGGFLMIHNAASFIDILGYFQAKDLQGVIDDLSKEINLHGKINESIANDYVKRTGKKLEDVLAWMEEETWFTAKEAKENGFVDRIIDGEVVDVAYDNLCNFTKTPDAIKNRETRVSKRTVEKALRDAGISNKQAKAIIAEGYREGDDAGDSQRDADNGEAPVIDKVPDKPEVASQDSQRDVDTSNDTAPKKIDRVAELLIAAEKIAPTSKNK